MSVDPDELRASPAATDSIEAVFIDEICTASRLMTLLRERRTEGLDPAWLRRYSQYQNMFHRALKSLEQHRKFKVAHPQLFPIGPPGPGASPAAPGAPVEPPPPPASFRALANRFWPN